MPWRVFITRILSLIDHAPCRLLIFAKAPIPGAVKTRLCPPLNPAGAAKFSERLLKHALRAASRADLGAIELWCAPTTAHDFFHECQREFNISLHQQSSGDMGDRMQHALNQALTRADSALLMGADCPTVSAAYLRVAAGRLAQDCELLFGPAEDGGYGLIGARGKLPGIFSGIPWGTDVVMSRTRDILIAMDYKWLELATLWDVDRPADLMRLEQEADLRYLLDELTN